MRLTRCYTDQSIQPGQALLLEQGASHHLLHVLRLRPGDKLVLFNGDGLEYDGVLQAVEKKQARVSILYGREPHRESHLKITLGQGISRGERMDFVLQKSVELGVNSLCPLWTRRCQVHLKGSRLDKRINHWSGIIQSACEQSGRLLVPKLTAPANIEDWCTQTYDKGHRIVLDPTADRNLDTLPPTDQVTILIGPEGGLDAEELDLASSNGFIPIRLGPRVLRTETAALTALTAVQMLWGDLLT